MKLPPICYQCIDKVHCDSLCNGIDILANGNIPCKEMLLSNPYDDHHSNTDYKDILSDIQSGKPIDIEDIRQIDSAKVKTIAALLYADMSIKEIAQQLKVSPSYIYRQLRVHMDKGFKSIINKT